ncbi:WD40 repeat domain-containing protein [Actinacidiphila glaucinigra]|uniref:WD40 repeat domain-containing protein n=1 Tax=Actinacidiphila glaucinigra TaxID=235986 RepID=UPI0037CCBDAD
MNVDELVRDSLREQAAEQPALGPGFADRVLTVRRRRRNRALASAAAATAAVVAVAVAVPLLNIGKDDVRIASETNRNGILAHPDQTPPRDLIAAGPLALAAYYTWETDARGAAVRAYRLLDPKTGTYVRTPQWSVVDVAPGLRTAAVLERDLPAKRIGLLNLRTGEVERWIPVDRGVAGVEFSPDGGRLLATTYSKNPELRVKSRSDTDGDGDGDWVTPPGRPTGRTGFYVLEVASGKGSWSGVTDAGRGGSHADCAFNHDGKLVSCGTTSRPLRQYYDFAGDEVATPANEVQAERYRGVGLSPDGKLFGGLSGGTKFKWYTELLDAYTGKKVTTVRGRELLAWVDNKRLIALDLTPGSDGSVGRLVLVTIGSDKVVPLSGISKGFDGAAGYWTPVFAER